MRISLNWLKDYIDYQGTAKELDHILTSAGLEVEGIEQIGADLEQVIIGKVIDTAQHPDADKLKVCTVFDGKENLQIVCGAPNVRAGLTVALSPIGCVLPDPNNPNGFKIKKSKIRGVESFGMLCAEDELGLGNDHDGIMELPENLEAGKPFMQSMGLPFEVLEISITPNRPDCLSYLGVAREVAAATGLKIKQPEIGITHSDFKSEEISSVTIENENCGRYIGLAVKEVKLKESPKWLKQRLEESGVRSINNVVDITNFVMLETGNPLHAFDANLINGKQIIVRMAKSNEKMHTLDEQERKLLESDLVICDAKAPVALAGVMGGLNSEIKNNTKDVFIEVAYFHPPTVRKTSRRLGLQTDSSYRFERGVDPNSLEFVAKRTAHLLQNLAEGKVASNLIDVYPQKISPVKVLLRNSRVELVLGKKLETSTYKNKLEAIGFKIIKQNSDDLELEVPTFRPDVTREIDLIEEIARLVNYESFPYSTPKMNIKPLEQNSYIAFARKTKGVLAELGLNETISLHFTGLKDIKNLQLREEDPRSNPIQLKNPITEDFSHMQTSLVPNLLRALHRNISHFENDVQIFEVGRIFLRTETADQFPKLFSNGLTKENIFVKDNTNRFLERSLVAGLLNGSYISKSWNQKAQPHDFYTVKGLVLQALKRLNIEDLQLVEPREIDTYLHKGKSAAIKCKNEIAGVFGEILPNVAKAFDLKTTPYVFEFDLATLLRAAHKGYQFKPISKFPSVQRDLSFAFKKSVDWKDIEKGIQKLNLKHFKGVHLFDQFTGGDLKSDEHSLTIKLAFQSNEQTLEEKDTQKAMNKTIEFLTTEFSAVQR